MAVGDASEAKSPIRVTGDGHRGNGHSGGGVSAIGHRLQAPAAEPRDDFLNRSPFIRSIAVQFPFGRTRGRL